MNPVPITVLVPAYKAEYLSLLLDSLCAQTDKDFLVLVGDDAGPAEIRAICESFSSKLNLKYVGFDQNLGGRSLAGQWNRCLEHVEDEWVLMPGDDDTLHAECIQRFRLAVINTEGRYAAYRATLRGIDGNDVEQYVYPPAEYEDSEIRLMALADPGYRGTVIEFLFSRTRLRSIGGFVDFPVGWYSDTATWILLATKGGILGVADAIVNHRSSGLNLSSFHRDLVRQKHDASLRFINWVESNREAIGVSVQEWVKLKSGMVWGVRELLARDRLMLTWASLPRYARAISAIESKMPVRELVRLMCLFVSVRFGL
jgi:glycosyltransferase involved in cell wall biosynthesis